MKRILKALSVFSLSLVLLLAMTITASAKEIISVSAEAKDYKITVSGKTEAGTLACAVFVYDKTGENMLDMETCAVNADNTFKYELSKKYEKGTYTIKVADYDGGAYKTTTVDVADAKVTPENVTNTGDNSLIIVFAGLMLLSASTFIILKKKNI